MKAQTSLIILGLLAVVAVFQGILLGLHGRTVQCIFASAPLFMSILACLYIYSEYMNRTRRPIEEDEDEDEAAAARAPTHMDIGRFICCCGLLLTTLLDALRIGLKWNALPGGFTVCPLTLTVAIFVSVTVDAVGGCLGF